LSTILGIGLHAMGGASSASSIVPGKFTRNWDWDVYWLIFAFTSMVALPIIGVWLTIPNAGQAIAETPRDTLLICAALGFVYGFGSYAFGWAIRLIGFSQTYCISIGFSATLGTIIPPLVLGGEPLDRLLHTSLGLFVGGALLVGLLGMYLIAKAGIRRERMAASPEDESAPAPRHGSHARFGIAVALASGALSAAYGLSLKFGEPLANRAQDLGASPLLKSNVVFLFSNGAAFISTLMILIPLLRRKETLRQFISAPGGSLPRNYGLGILAGLAWYMQFFFYGMAEHFMGAFSVASWALHMILLIVFAQTWGFYFREWNGVDGRTRALLYGGLGLLVIAVLTVALGNATEGA